MFSSRWDYENTDTDGVTFIFTPDQLIALEHAAIEGGIKRIETIRSVLGETAAQAIRSARAKIVSVLAKEAPTVFTIMELMVLEHVIIDCGINDTQDADAVFPPIAQSLTDAYEKIARAIENL